MNYIAKKITVDLGKSNDPSDPRTVMQLLQMVVGAWAKLAVSANPRLSRFNGRFKQEAAYKNGW